MHHIQTTLFYLINIIFLFQEISKKFTTSNNHKIPIKLAMISDLKNELQQAENSRKVPESSKKTLCQDRWLLNL